MLRHLHSSSVAGLRYRLHRLNNQRQLTYHLPIKSALICVICVICG
ncbi:MAG: CRISPR-associated protein Cas5 [Opitutaceae bacterium]|nr:CRISPR-associated protein Cas5 [Opitutaceae bacterium]